jgi:hypothetical protein
MSLLHWSVFLSTVAAIRRIVILPPSSCSVTYNLSKCSRFYILTYSKTYFLDNGIGDGGGGKNNSLFMYILTEQPRPITGTNTESKDRSKKETTKLLKVI